MCGKYCVNQKLKTEVEFTKHNRESDHQYNQCINATIHVCETKTKIHIN